MTAEALSPIAAAIAELLAAVGSTCGNRIRAHEPAAGDSKTPFQRFVVVAWGDGPPIPHMPIRDVTLYVRFYGTNYVDAEAFGMLGEAVFRNVGARKAASGLGIWHSQVVSSGIDHDPYPPTGTGQPLWALVVRFPTTLAAI
jgi:hypothetical protein